MEDNEINEKTSTEVEIKPKEELNNSTETVIRLTPTGKISHAKTRVYTQRYRKEWELMSDFKDWLASVPFQATRAFCKYCQRNLHAHRLSLLKHMCTLKHQRAAVQYNQKLTGFEEQQEDESTCEVNYVVENVETDEYDEDDNYNAAYNEVHYNQDGEEISIESEVQEVIESETEDDSNHFKKIRLEKKNSQDTLAQAMAHVNSELLSENDESIQLEMEIEQNDDNDLDSKSYHYMKYQNSVTIKEEHDVQRELFNENHKNNEEDVQNSLNYNDEETGTPTSSSEAKSFTQPLDKSKKLYLVSSSTGKSYTLVKSKLPQFVLNKLGDKNITLVAKTKNDLKNIKDIKQDNVTSIKTAVTAASAENVSNKNFIVMNSSTLNAKYFLTKKPIVTTNVLETSKGIPACGLQVSLYKLQDGRWTFLHESFIQENGNSSNFSSMCKNNLIPGRYKLHYDVEKFYNMKKITTIYPFIEIVFDIKDPNGTYHIPLLLSPFSYSTYKDSNR